MRQPPDAGPEDGTLMREFQAGDEGAFDTLVRRHRAFVVRHAGRYLGDDPGVDDVAQEVFLRVYRSGDLFREDNSFRGWLATITSRLALNELRTRRRKRWLPRSSLESAESSAEWRPGEDPGLAGSDDPGAGALRNERVEAVRDAVGRLPERQREALWLQRFEGWELKEVGKTLGLTVPAVKSLLHRARASLMKELAPFMRGQGAIAEDEAQVGGAGGQLAVFPPLPAVAGDRGFDAPSVEGRPR